MARRPNGKEICTGHHKAWIAALLVLVSLVAPACGKQDEAGAASLEGTAWVLASYGPQDSLQPVLADTEVTLEFGTAEEGISGSAGCNHYFGGLTAKGNGLSVSGLGMTEMYCTGPEGVRHKRQRISRRCRPQRRSR